MKMVRALARSPEAAPADAPHVSLHSDAPSAYITHTHRQTQAHLT